jgi:hypothetical protein
MPFFPIFLDLIARVILGEENESLSSTTSNFLQSPVTSSLLGPATCHQTPSAYIPPSMWETKFHTHSYSTSNRMHLLSQIIYSCKTLYMFRTVLPYIIRSSKLRIQHLFVRHISLLYKQFWAPDDGRKDRPKHVELFTRIKIWDNSCILLVVL